MREFRTGLWIADGPPVSTMGVAFPTRMIVVRLRDGSLWINSPVEMSRDDALRITEFGPVRHLVAPTRMHAWRLERWAAYFPEAALWTPANLGDEPPEQWRTDLDQVVFRGNALLDEIEFFHPASRSLIFADFIQQYPKESARPLRNAFLGIAGVFGRARRSARYPHIVRVRESSRASIACAAPLMGLRPPRPRSRSARGARR